MARVQSAVFALLFSLAGAVFAQDTPRFEVISEYVGQLITADELQRQAEQDSKGANGNTQVQMMNGIRHSTRVKLELTRSINAFNEMKLSGQLDSVLPTMNSFYKQKIDLHDQLIDIATQFSAGPKPGVDYGKLAAAMPQITATLEYIDQSIFKATPIFCLMLIDERPNSAGKLNYLVLTTAQRKELIGRLDRAFGARLKEKHQNFTVSAASVIREFLAGKHKSADAPR